MQPNTSRAIAHALVGVFAGAVVAKVIGPKAGLVSTLAVIAIHESLDAPVSSFIDQTARGLRA